LAPFTIPELTLYPLVNSKNYPPDPTDQNVGVWRDVKGKIFALTQVIESEYWIHWQDLASFCLQINHNRIQAYVLPEIDANIVHDIFQRSILPYHLQLSGYEVLHASSIRKNKSVIAFCAVSGMGKSTLAYALSFWGNELWSDDALVIETFPTPPSVFKIPFYIRLLPDAYDFFVDETTNNRFPNKKPFSNSTLSQNHANEAELSTIIFIERIKELEKNSTIQLEPILPTEAYPLIVKNAYVFENEDKNRKKQMLENYLDLVSKINIYKLQYPSELYKLSDLIIAIDKLI
jgi:hypothetical protein